MEDLSKQQLVLLGILIAFVTSIATGITTVSLMQQEPGGVTQTINRVVERTVEKVVQVPNQQASVVTTKETLVVKADDMIVDAIEKNTNSLPVIYEFREVAAEGETAVKVEYAPVARAVYLPDDTIAVDSGLVDKNKKYFVGKDSVWAKLEPVSKKEVEGFAFFTFVSTSTPGIKFKPVVLKEKPDLKLGQAVIAIGGAEKMTVSEGIISALREKEIPSADGGADKIASTSAPSKLTSYSIVESTALLPDSESGGVLVNLTGEVVGISSGYFSNGFVFSGLLVSGVE